MVKAAHREGESHRIALFNAVDLDGDSKLTLEEVLVGAPIPGLSEDKAREVFTELDTEGKGYLELPEVPRPRWTDTVQGQSCVLLAELYGAFLLGALLMKTITAEHETQPYAVEKATLLSSCSQSFWRLIAVLERVKDHRQQLHNDVKKRSGRLPARRYDSIGDLL